MIDAAVGEIEPRLGTAPACRALGASRASLYRRRAPVVVGERPPRPPAPPSAAWINKPVRLVAQAPNPDSGSVAVLSPRPAEPLTERQISPADPPGPPNNGSDHEEVAH